MGEALLAAGFIFTFHFFNTQFRLRLVAALKKANITLNRKMLADIAVRDTKAFAAVVTQAK